MAKQVVNGPVRQPLPYGLFSVLTPRTPDDPHWENGVTWEPLTCQPASGIGNQCEDTEGWGLPKNFSEVQAPGEADSFTVYGSYECSPIGHALEYAQERATEHLLAREEAAAESILWNGVGPGESGASSPTSPNLLAEAETLNEGTELDPVVALGLLEDFISTEYGSLGVIHTSRAGATVLLQAGLVSGGNVLRTGLGTPVVAGAGYSTTAGPTSTLVIASPALLGYRSNVFTSSARSGDLLDRGTNDLFAIAERQYVIGWDPCGVGAVNMSLVCC